MGTGIRLGIIGCGSISHSHLAAAADLPDVEVVAASNRTETKLIQVSEKHKIPHRYRDWRDLLADDDVDAVVICLPEGLHRVVAIEAAMRGKHVLVEKPMSSDLEGCEAMVRAAEQSHTVLMVAQVLRYFDSHVLARQWIREGRIGKVLTASRRRMMTDSFPDIQQWPWAANDELAADWLLYGTGSHEYDALLWLLDTKAKSVSARGEKAPSRWSGWATITSAVTLPDEVTANVSLSLCSEKNAWDTVITGSEGSLTFTITEIILNGQKTEVGLPKKAFKAQMAEFADCIRTGREPGPSGRNVRSTMALLEGVKRSMMENRLVRMSELGCANTEEMK